MGEYVEIASEPYHKAGRGGVGNHFSQENVESQEQSALKDVEAQASSNPITAECIDRFPPKYALSGRGGFGNLYSPQGLQQNGSANSGSDVPTAIPAVTRPSYSGRGGVGNYENNSRIKKAEETARKGALVGEMRKREKDVTKEVELELKPPEQAHLVTKRSSDAK